jgi:class 3 adenylate cyclase/predicted ATPase
MSSAEQTQLEASIAALQAQRALLGDSVVDEAVAPLKARLAALRKTGGAVRRAQVTVLFTDVVDSTALMRHRDAEDTLQVIDAALERVAACVRRHGGRVLRYTGDGLKAAFGMDMAQEDDAARAVQAGLDMLTIAGEHAAAVERELGVRGFALRVGVHTGPVALGAGAEAENSVTGEAVNIAARLEQAAPPGALRISADTYAQVRGQFEVQAQPPLWLKGVDAPVQTYLVLRAKPRRFRIPTRGIEGVATRMIGREAELEQLQAAFLHVVRERRLLALTVVGEAGLGKSRLLNAFEAWSEARPENALLFRGQATPQTASQPYGLLRDLIAWRFQIQDDDSLATARDKLLQGLLPLFTPHDGAEQAEARVHQLGHLIGIDWRDSRHLKGILDDPAQIRNRAFRAAVDMFSRLGASPDRIVLLQLDDLHWADDESLDFLGALAQVGRELPLLLLALTRPTLFERRADWRQRLSDGAVDGEGQGQRVHQRLDLTPLDKRASRDLANELLQKLATVPAALRELLTSSAEGNPFYMEELLRMLIDQGAVSTGDPWTVDAQRLLLTRVPASLTGVLQARLDGLPAVEKRALQCASVVGAVFWDRALAAVDADAAGQLPALVQRELTLPRPDADLHGLREYAFRHHLLHQVAYETVPRRQRQQAHAAVAHWLADQAAQGGLRAGDVLGWAATHFELAGHIEQAAEFHTRAAEQALERLAHERVLSHAGRALALLDATHPPPAAAPELRWRVLCARERTLALLARRGPQADDLVALHQLADALDDDRRRAEVARRQAVRAMRLADAAGMEAAARACVAYATRAGDAALRLNAQRLLVYAATDRGDLAGARALGERSLAEARTLGLRDTEGRLLNALALLATGRGDLLQALELHVQAMQALTEDGDLLAAAGSRHNLGVGWLNLGALARARTELNETLLLVRAHGDRVMESNALGNLSAVALALGDAAQALTLAQQALQLAEAAEAADIVASAAIHRTRAELALGLTDAAAGSCAQALAVLPPGHPRALDLCAVRARVALAQDKLPAALEAVQPVLDQLARGGTLDATDNARRIEICCHQVLERAADPRAEDWLLRAHTRLMEQARTIADPALRQDFLQHGPGHGEIVAAWRARAARLDAAQGGAPPSPEPDHTDPMAAD